MPPTPSLESSSCAPCSGLRSRWSGDRCAWLGYLVGLGWDAKRIARDPLIRSTANNVYRQAHKLGLSFANAPTSSTTLRLPLATGAVYDRAANRLGLTRDAMIRRAVIALASDPDAIERLSTR